MVGMPYRLITVVGNGSIHNNRRCSSSAIRSYQWVEQKENIGSADGPKDRQKSLGARQWSA